MCMDLPSAASSSGCVGGGGISSSSSSSVGVSDCGGGSSISRGVLQQLESLKLESCRLREAQLEVS